MTDGQQTYQDLLAGASEDAFRDIKRSGWASSHNVQMLERDEGDAQRTLEALQVSTRSALGAVAYHTGGIRVADGWLRILGAGSKRIPRAIDLWNGFDRDLPRHPAGLLVADDILGGFFCWMQASLTIAYLPPDTLEWEDLEVGYAEWLEAMLGDPFKTFYEDAHEQWPTWQEEARAVQGDQVLHIWPPLVAEGPPIPDRARKAVPVEEGWNLALELAAKLRDVPDGAEVKIDFGD